MIEKKTTFMRQCIGELNLHNAKVINQRVETYAPTNQFDAVISRAFASLADFVNNAAHLVIDCGRLLAMKGHIPHDEIIGLPITHSVEKIYPLHVPQIDGERHLLILRKVYP